jgi:O-antigen/teichoic acid export membrane protein
MSKKRITRNVVWNVAGILAPMLAGFVIAPFLVNRLGQTTYGLWILIGSLSGYFGMLDLGIRGSVGRNMALFLAKDDRQRVNEIFATAVAYLLGMGLLTMLVTCFIPTVFFRLVDVPADETAAVTLALLLTGAHLACWLPLNVFDATLWAGQRFDLINAVDIPVTFLRLVLTYLVVVGGYGLVGLAASTLVLNLLTGIAKATLTFWGFPWLRLSPRLVTSTAWRALFGYSIWLFLFSLSRSLYPQVSLLIIGSRLAVSSITPYSFASRLLQYAGMILIAATGVLTPVATGLHATGDLSRQRDLFRRGSSYCTGLALYFLLVFVFLGGPIITLWVGHDMPPAPLLLAILTAGEALPLAMFVAQSLVFAMGAHRPLALVSALELVGNFLLALLLVDTYGVVGVCVAMALLGFVCRGIVPALYGCHLLKVRPYDYGRDAIVPALGPALLAGLPLAGLTSWSYPHGWAQLLLYGTAFTLFYLLCFALLTAREEVRLVRQWWQGRRGSPLLPAQSPLAVAALDPADRQLAP